MKFSTEQAHVELLLTRPFFGVLLSSLEVRPSTSVPTACTNGRIVWINPGFWKELPRPEQETLLAHEALHVGLLHHARIGGRDLARWNIAADLVVNALLIESGFCLPKGCLVDASAGCRSVEEVYDSLPEGEASSPWGEVSLGDSGEEETDRIRDILARAYAIGRGDLPAGLNRVVWSVVAPPEVPWWQILAGHVRHVAREDFSSTRFSRAHIYRGIYLPSLRSPRLSLVVVLDTSGSVSEGDLSEFSAAVVDIQSTYPSSVQVLYCDTAVHDGGIFEDGDPVIFSPQGGGGTDYRPPFGWIEKNLDNPPDCAVYLTDGECDSWPHPPGFPVVWAIRDGRGEWRVDVWG